MVTTFWFLKFESDF